MNVVNTAGDRLKYLTKTIQAVGRHGCGNSTWQVRNLCENKLKTGPSDFCKWLPHPHTPSRLLSSCDLPLQSRCSSSFRDTD